MQAFIGPKLLESREAQPRVKPFEISDCQLLGFTLRVQPSGARSYYVRFFRNRRVTLGKVDSLSPEEARDRCQRYSATSRTAATRYTQAASSIFGSSPARAARRTSRSRLNWLILPRLMSDTRA